MESIDPIKDQSEQSAGASPGTAHDPKPTPMVTEAHRRLEPFIGTWTVAGHEVGAAPNAPTTPVTGEESYAWLPGRFFLLGHWDHRFGSDRHIGLDIIRYDANTGQYSSYTVDNLGFAQTYRVTQRDNVWFFIGDWERATWALSHDGQTMTIDWEITRDGETWEPLCHLDATKQTGGLARA
jgi:hypothetical protein